MSYSETVSRKSDMGEGMALTLYRQLDGDVILDIHPEDHAGSIRNSVEFCTSGGQSHHTVMALNALWHAMKKDQEARPQELVNNPPAVEADNE